MEIDVLVRYDISLSDYEMEQIKLAFECASLLRKHGAQYGIADIRFDTMADCWGDIHQVLEQEHGIDPASRWT